ncbi:MAG: hypothetical protein WC222_08615 [Parachlamydiales bacterium]
MGTLFKKHPNFRITNVNAETCNAEAERILISENISYVIQSLSNDSFCCSIKPKHPIQRTLHFNIYINYNDVKVAFLFGTMTFNTAEEAIAYIEDLEKKDLVANLIQRKMFVNRDGDRTNTRMHRCYLKAVEQGITHTIPYTFRPGSQARTITFSYYSPLHSTTRNLQLICYHHFFVTSQAFTTYFKDPSEILKYFELNEIPGSSAPLLILERTVSNKDKIER